LSDKLVEQRLGFESTRTYGARNKTTRTPFFKFSYAISSEQTKEYYFRKLKVFLEYLDIPKEPFEDGVNTLYDQIQEKGIDWFTESLIDFIVDFKQRVTNREITAGTLRNYYKPIKLFCDMNNILLNWKLIARGIPSSKRAAMDRAPTLDEIHKLLEFPTDERIKPIVLVMVSTGIRLGAWEFLKWKHVTPITDYSERKIIAAKLIVYAEEPEQYYTFMTAEAYLSLKQYMDFRAENGERITGESWLMRNRWRTTDVSYGGKFGLAANPKQLLPRGIKSLIQDIYFRQGIRPLLKKGQKRHEFKAMHGFRKFYKTMCEQVMKPANIELLIGHTIGISSSYYKPTENQLLEDYLNAADYLTISKEYKLQKQVDYYKQRADKLEEMSVDIEEMKKKLGI
jgi:integrase